MHSILLADTALNSIALNSIEAGSNAEAWCIFLGAELCDPLDTAQVEALGELTLLSLEFVEGVPPIPVFDIPLSAALNSIALNSIALNSIDISNTALNSIALNSIALNSIALNSIALNSIALNSIALNSIALNSIALNSIALNSIALNSIALNSIALNSIALNSIDIANTALNSIALNSIEINSSALNSISVDCTLADCVNGTLGAAVAAGAIDPTTPLGVLLGAIDTAELADVPLGDTLAAVDAAVLGTLSMVDLLEMIDALVIDTLSMSHLLEMIGSTVLGGLSLPDLLEMIGPVEVDNLLLGDLLDMIDPTVLAGFSLADLLLAFLAPTEVPFETIDLDSALLQNVADPLQPEFHYVATIDVAGGPADIDVTLNLPAGFAFATNPLSGSPATFAGQPVSPNTSDLSMLEFTLSDVPAGSHQLIVAARAGLTTGTFSAFTTAAGTAGDQSDTAGPAEASVNVVEAFDDDGPGSTPPVLGIDGELQLAHIARSDDVDLYSFEVPTTGFEGTSARILLSNIPTGVDYDLTVFAPPVSPLRGDPTDDLTSIGDIGFDLDPTDDIYSTDVVQDIPLTTVQDWLGVDTAVRGVSSRRSSANEEVETATLEPGKTYYVQVTSYNGDLSDQPYALRLRLSDGTTLPPCAAGERPFPHPLPPAADLADVVIPPGVNTLFVTNTRWLEATLGADDGNPATNEADDVLASIDAVATSGYNGVVGGFVPVDAYGAVDAAYNTWRNDRCDVDDRNAVVTAIGDVLDGITDANPGIENIVIVGDDGVVPMAGIPDLTTIAPEASFAPEVVTPNLDGSYSSNELSAVLGAGMLLSDDPYGTGAGILVGDHELFVPDRNLGRLVESADQIVTSLEHFVTYEGKLDPQSMASALVSGYDFLSDGADDVKAALEDDGLTVNTGLPAGTDDLIGDDWDRDDLLAGFNVPGLDAISPNAHYDYESLLPALQNAQGTWDQSDLLTVDDVAALSPDPDPTIDTLANPERATVVFSMGCHAGLSVSDVQLGFSATDWAETYATGNNLLIAQSTYGYGDSDVVALSERLIALFAGNLSEMSVGEAARFAKAEYLATTLVLTPYDEKILQSLTNYGLPMYEMGGSPAIAALAAPAATTSPADLGPTVDGITPVSVDLTVGVGGSSPTNLNLVTIADEGSYYEVAGDVVAVHYRPVEPLVDLELPAGIDARGFLITELTSQDETPFDPLYFRPSIDLGAREPRVSPDDSSFPASLQRVTSFDTRDGERQRLLLAAGQFQAGLENDGLAAQDVQRLFTHIGGDLYSAGPDPTDTDGPLFSRAIGRVSEEGGENVAQFEITVSDSTRCHVMFRRPLSNVWTSVPLSQVGTTDNWLGAAPVLVGTTEVEFFTQCVDANGNVSISDNKVDNYLAAEVVEQGEFEIGLVSAAGSAGGYFRGAVDATVTGLPSPLPDDYSIQYSIDSQLPFFNGVVIDDPINGNIITVDNLSGAGGHVILVQDSEGNREFRFFIIDDAAPLLTATASQDTSVSWANQPVTVTLSAVDVGQSGVASIEYSTETVAAGGITSTGPIVVTESSVPVIIGDDGITTVTATATDVAGNTTAETVTVVRVDQSAPIVTATPSQDTSVNWANQPVTVTLSAVDIGDSGVASIEYSTVTVAAGGSITTTGPLPYSVPVVISADGTTTLTATATDAADNPSAPEVVAVRIDQSAPTVTATASPSSPTWLNQSVTITLTAVDVGPSGVASIEYSTETVAAGGTTTTGPLPYSVPVVISADGTTTLTATATDAAGNPSAPEVIVVSVDQNAPSFVGCTGTPGVWFATNQTITCAVTDAGSGFGGFTTTTVDLSTNVDSGVETSNASTGSATVTDDSGLSVDVGPIGGFWIDRKAPVITNVQPRSRGAAHHRRDRIRHPDLHRRRIRRRHLLPDRDRHVPSRIGNRDDHGHRRGRQHVDDGRHVHRGL